MTTERAVLTGLFVTSATFLAGYGIMATTNAVAWNPWLLYAPLALATASSFLLWHPWNLGRLPNLTEREAIVARLSRLHRNGHKRRLTLDRQSPYLNRERP